MKKGIKLTIVATFIALATFTSNAYAEENTRLVDSNKGGQAVRLAAKKPVVKKTAVKKSVPTEVIETAQSLVGVPYRFGGNSTKGFDCSGFVSYVLNTSGYDFPRYTAYDYWTKFKRLNTPQPGDLVLFKNTYKAGPSHVGIYIGDNKFIHSASGKGVVVNNLSERYYRQHFLGYVNM
ncbi:MAG: hypothetical protein K0S34_2354 [Bacillales bacterium]|jgi:peptidoglycan endopeptidase LytE|nr:hypothetical protein [Bacillales bacterium]